MSEGPGTQAATVAFMRALRDNPNDAAAYAGLGQALAAAGRHDEAVRTLTAALALNQGAPHLRLRLARSLAQLGRFAEAVEQLTAAAQRDPGNAVIHNRLGVALKALGRHDAALAAYRKAEAMDPGSAAVQHNLGNLLRLMGRQGEALAAYEAALDRAPDDGVAFNSYAFLLRQTCTWRDLARVEAQLCERVRRGGGEVTPFSFLCVTDDPALQLACARAYAARRGLRAGPAPPSPRRVRSRKLRIGYISGDLREHPVGWLLPQMVECHDRDRFEAWAFSFGRDDGGATRRRLSAAFHRFVECQEKSDEAIAAMIAEAGIDIAVDLMGHTRDNRLGILARRPAPIQVHYLGFPGTLGVDFIDYMLVDDSVVPAGTEANFTEQLVRLPGSFFVSDRNRVDAGGKPERQSFGLPPDGFVFYAIGNGYKINPAIFDVWMRLVAAVPGSVLWLLADNATMVDNLRREATSRGVDPNRMVFAPRIAPAAHLARHRAADLMLDTVPYNAGTTANEALWAGLPIVTCAGRSVAARMAASQLHAVGLADLVARDLADYERVALALTRDPGRLKGLRERLATARASAPLFDTGRATRAIEAAYLRMAAIHDRGGPPRGFPVSWPDADARSGP